MTDPKRIGIEEARVNLGELLNRARYKRETFLIARHGEPLALLIPIDCIPTLQPATRLDLHGSAEPRTAAQKRFGVLARMVPAHSKT